METSQLICTAAEPLIGLIKKVLHFLNGIRCHIIFLTINIDCSFIILDKKQIFLSFLFRNSYIDYWTAPNKLFLCFVWFEDTQPAFTCSKLTIKTLKHKVWNMFKVNNNWYCQTLKNSNGSFFKLICHYP